MADEYKAGGKNRKNNNMKIRFPTTTNIIASNCFYAYSI